MSLNNLLPQTIRVIAPRRLTRPKSPRQFRECYLTSLAVQDMTHATAELILSSGNGMPLVRFCYEKSCLPEPFWTSYLHIQIDLECGGWLGRLSHFSIDQRAFIIHPCLDGTQPDLSRHVVQQSQFNLVTQVKISVPFAPDLDCRHFSFIAPRVLH